LDEIDSGRSHVLTRSTTPTDFSTGAMYLKTSTAKVSSMTVSLAETAKPFQAKPPPFAKAVRKDSAVHVSLSSDSLVKHPGTLRLRRSFRNTPAEAGAPNPAHPTRRREHGHD